MAEETGWGTTGRWESKRVGFLWGPSDDLIRIVFTRLLQGLKLNNMDLFGILPSAFLEGTV